LTAFGAALVACSDDTPVDQSATDGAADGATCAPIVTAKLPTTVLDDIGPGPDSNWLIVTSSPSADGGAPTFVPPASASVPNPTTSDGRSFLQLTGSGLGAPDFGLLAFAPRPPGADPTDFSDTPGLTFDAKGSNLTIQIETVDTDPRFCKCTGTDCFEGYRAHVALTSTWATYTVKWEEFKLPSLVVNQAPLDLKDVVSISFGGIAEDFDVAIDNLAIAPSVDASAGD
jgi:hypothetical protein